MRTFVCNPGLGSTLPSLSRACIYVPALGSASGVLATGVTLGMSSAFTKAVCMAMERIAPIRLAEKWDNVGLLLESPQRHSQNRTTRNGVLLTIDLTPSVLSEALNSETTVVVAYHPPIFKGLQSLTLSNALQSSLLHCAAKGISVYSPHTSLDCVWGGVNDWLAEGVLDGKDNGNIRALSEEVKNHIGISEGGRGRLVTLNEPIAMEMLESRIKKYLKLSQIQVGYASLPLSNSKFPPVRTVAVCAGSGGSMLVGEQADVYFTGEMSHHEVLAAVAAGKHVILCGHSDTERGYLPTLAEKLCDELRVEGLHQDLGSWEVVVSEKDRHPLCYV